MLPNELGRFVADVQVYVVHAMTFHLEVYGAGNNITWRQLGTIIVLLHETVTVRQC